MKKSYSICFSDPLLDKKYSSSVVSLGYYFTLMESIKNKNEDKLNLRLEIEILKISLTHNDNNKTIDEHIMVQGDIDSEDLIGNCIRGLVLKFEKELLSEQ